MTPTTDNQVRHVLATKFSPNAAKGLLEVYQNWRATGMDPQPAFLVALRVMVEGAEVEDDPSEP